jgi:L-alanine-DL-glutamate epimerase-like enolase superfamily enzyme
MIHDIIADTVEARDGMVAIPDGPGLGFTMNEAAIEKYARRP